MSECIFCDVVSGTSPTTCLFQDDQVMVVKDIYPQAPVHWLVITKKHYGEFLDVPQTVIAHMMRVVRNVITDEHIANYRIVNNGKGAAYIDHVHIHVMGNVDKARTLQAWYNKH